MVLMQQRKRFYTSILRDHARGHRQMGKTTICLDLGDVYRDWDNDDHREIILKGPAAVAVKAGLEMISEKTTVVVFDELHKYRRWKIFLKRFF